MTLYPDAPARTDIALVLGGARSVWLDVAALERIIEQEWPGLVVAANDVGVHWKRRLDAWTSLHPDRMTRADVRHPKRWSWLDQREQSGGNTPELWARKNRFGVPNTVDDRFKGGSSGLLAVEVALQMGAQRVVLCGVPMSQTPHFAESIDHGPLPWKSADSHWRAWHRHRVILEERVRSMSGRTLDTFGAPTRDWILGENHE